MAILAGPPAPSPQPSPVNLTREGPDVGTSSSALTVGVYRQSQTRERLTAWISASLIALLTWCGGAGICRAQAGGGAAQSSGGPSFAAPPDKQGGVLEIAPQVPPQPAPSAAEPQDQNAEGKQNPDDQAGEDDVVLYKAYSGSEGRAPQHGPLPYLGVSVHSMIVTQPDGSQQRALEVLSVDQSSPAAAAGLKGSGSPTNLGASSLTASAMLGPAQELLAPLLKKAGQLGHQGDLIVAADDNRVGSEDDLAGELARLKPGDTMWLTVLRESAKGKPKAVRIPIKLAPPQGAGAAAAAK